MNKLPQVALAFWVMQICATTLGETTRDLLTKPDEEGGFDLRTIGSFNILLLVLVGMIAYMQRKSPDVQT